MQVENEYTEGKVVLIDKPLNWTSFDVVNKIRYAISKQIGRKKIKVGHAGTLDPLATGLVVICTGKMTKTIDSLLNSDKVYEAELFLGATTPSFDAETEIDSRFPIEHINQTLIDEVLEKFLGETAQVPPVFSAISVDGKRAYKSARQGIELDLPPRNILISEITQLGFDGQRLRLRIACSKGTYIRALARDIGKALGSGAYLTALRRTQSGSFRIEEAVTIDEFVAQLQATN